MFGFHEKKSTKCKNCGEWSFDEERKDQFVLEEKLKQISEILKEKDDEKNLSRIREIVNV